MIIYKYSSLRSYPHSPESFTQGLYYDDGILYESTGIRGKSSLLKVELETGRILKQRLLPMHYFGEGIAAVDNKIIQLTWDCHAGLVYDKESFELIGKFSYPTEGWGLTFDGNHLIMSDGTSTLYFLDPVTFQRIKEIQVHHRGYPVEWLNDLQYIHGHIYANIWQSDYLAVISPQTGDVLGWVILENLLSEKDRSDPVDFLNGIAYDPVNDRLFVTGKFWPKLFEIEMLC